MKEDAGMSKPKKHANKVGKLTLDLQSLPYNPTYVQLFVVCFIAV